MRALSAAIGVSLVLLAAGAAAAPCNRPDLKDTMPPDAAVGVPSNASLHARYAISAEYLGEEIELSKVSTGESQTFSGGDASWVDVEGVLSVTPSAPLEPGELYRLSWPKLRGVASATLGTTREIEFEAGAFEDVELPVFEGLRDVEWDVERETDPCTDSQEERYVFDVEVPDAFDDGGRESLTLLVFQTRGPSVDPSAPKPVLVSRLPEAGKTVRISETIGRGVGEVCFAAVVRDLTGKVSGGGNVERCVETVEPPFFYGCSSTARGPGDFAAALFGFVLVLLGMKRRCARRC